MDMYTIKVIKLRQEIHFLNFFDQNWKTRHYAVTSCTECDTTIEKAVRKEKRRVEHNAVMHGVVIREEEDSPQSKGVVPFHSGSKTSGGSPLFDIRPLVTEEIQPIPIAEELECEQ